MSGPSCEARRTRSPLRLGPTGLGSTPTASNKNLNQASVYALPGSGSQFTEVERRAYTYNLGNLLLIDGPSGANDDLRNKEWPDKKTLIKSWPNQTPLTTEALKRQQWSAGTIDSRNDALASLAVKAFAT